MEEELFMLLNSIGESKIEHTLLELRNKIAIAENSI
jgi:hypothetical protein